jgi:dTDP-4-dehydrorhamnose reductase
MVVAVTGSRGQVGREVEKCGKEHDLQVVGFDRSALDITDPIAVKNTLQEANPALVVNAAAYTAVDQAESEPEAAYRVNRDGPAHLAAFCAQAGVPMIHISTDYVFDGRKPAPYTESDPINPLNVYGRSKATGEAAVHSNLREHVILRASWLYGVHGRNFVKTILRLGQHRDSLNIVDDQYGSPTWAADLAAAILEIARQIRRAETAPWGTYHYSGQGAVTWYGFAAKIFELAGEYGFSIRANKINPVSTAAFPTPAPRPRNSLLDCSLIKKTFGIEPPPWEESLHAMLKAYFS